MTVMVQCPHCHKPIKIDFFASEWVCPWCEAHGLVAPTAPENSLRLTELNE
jgi:ribosomal protein L37AE/L43A